MNPLYNSVARERIPINSFPQGGERKLSMKMGQIVPIYCRETIPGDTFKAATELLIKFAPLKAPVMHRIRAYVDYFFVPNLQVCKPFENFINPAVNTPDNPVVLPVITPAAINAEGKLGIGSLADYLDLPVQQSAWAQSENSEPISVLPFRVYQHVYNQYFRDETLQPLEGDPTTITLYQMADIDKQGDVTEDLEDSNQIDQMLSLRYSAWKKDYFTSALPTPQAGPDVEIPFTPGVIRADGPLQVEGSDTQLVTGSAAVNLYATDEIGELGIPVSGSHNALEYSSGLEIQAVPGSGLTVNAFRMMFALQHFQELQSRGGKRYPEVTWNFFGVRLPDLYVDRPAYLGGMYQDVTVGEVLQTSQSTTGESGSAQGYRAGVASLYGKTKTMRYRCKMHGFILGVLRVLPEAVYFQGVERMWTRTSIYDYAWPQFGNIGEQEIFNRELYVDGTAEDKKVFGYGPRYADWKDGCSHVNGEFRTSLRYWHFGRFFTERPLLNEAFIMADQVSTDPFNVTDPTEDKLYVHMYTRASVRRALPYWGTPGLSKL